VHCNLCDGNKNLPWSQHIPVIGLHFCEFRFKLRLQEELKLKRKYILLMKVDKRHGTDTVKISRRSIKLY
jgi:hypothetical protein